MWEEWRLGRGQPGRRWERGREVQGDFDDHTAEHEHEEQRKAETDVQGQDDGQNVRDDSGDYKDNDDQQDNEEERRGNQDIVIFCRVFDICLPDEMGLASPVSVL